MTIGEKITQLRKQRNWSQEDLAEKLDISRQAISKWESMASVPEPDKIVRLSEIFGVSTDYLLKEEAYACPAPEKAASPQLRRISRQEADTYIDLTKASSKYIALGVSLCILSPVCLILMGGIAENKGTLLGYSITENMAGGIGTVILLLMIAAATTIFIIHGMRLDKYKYLEKECFLLEAGLSEEISRRKEAFAPRFSVSVALGVVLCILSPAPLLLLAGFSASEASLINSLAFLLIVIALAVYLFVTVGMINDTYNVLLQTEDHKPESKKLNNILSGSYWCIITAIYLAISFTKNNWATSWIIWPIAVMVYCGIVNILQFILNKKGLL